MAVRNVYFCLNLPLEITNVPLEIITVPLEIANVPLEITNVPLEISLVPRFHCPALFHGIIAWALAEYLGQILRNYLSVIFVAPFTKLSILYSSPQHKHKVGVRISGQGGNLGYSIKNRCTDWLSIAARRSSVKSIT